MRELKVISLINQTTRKPNRDRKIFDGFITHEWRQEARDAGPMDVTDPMLDWVSRNECINDLASASTMSMNRPSIASTRYRNAIARVLSVVIGTFPRLLYTSMILVHPAFGLIRTRDLVVLTCRVISIVISFVVAFP